LWFVERERERESIIILQYNVDENSEFVDGTRDSSSRNLFASFPLLLL
jgi:hypothetical protein